MDENKFTPTAEEALQLAQEAAGELGHGYMGTEPVSYTHLGRRKKISVSRPDLTRTVFADRL